MAFSAAVVSAACARVGVSSPRSAAAVAPAEKVGVTHSVPSAIAAESSRPRDTIRQRKFFNSSERVFLGRDRSLRPTPTSESSQPLSHPASAEAAPSVTDPVFTPRFPRSRTLFPVARSTLLEDEDLAPRPAPLPVPQIVDAARLKIFSGPGNPALAEETANYMGTSLGRCQHKRFADGECYVRIDESVRGCDVFIIQPTCCPVNDRVMELMIMIDAARRASAAKITAVIPYFGYSRADKLLPADKASQARESITAKLVANLLTASGVDRVVAMDLHSLQTQGYFDIPLDHVYASPVLLDYLRGKNLGNNLVVVSPDIGGVARARAFAKELGGLQLAIVDKRRPAPNQCEVVNLIGEVQGKTCVLVDDMIDTAGTICNAANFLRSRGAKEVYACATHAVFSPPATERLSSGCFEEVIVTNTIPMPEEKRFEQLKVLSVAPLLGETILRVHEGSSVSAMFYEL
eukprot:tig00020909_g15327.t1